MDGENYIEILDFFLLVFSKNVIFAGDGYFIQKVITPPICKKVKKRRMVNHAPILPRVPDCPDLSPIEFSGLPL